MVRHHKAGGKAILAALEHLVVRVEEALARLGGGTAHDHVERGRLAHQRRERSREGRVAEALGRNLVGGDAADVGAHVVERAHRGAVVLVVAEVLLGELPEAHLVRQVHAELAAG